MTVSRVVRDSGNVNPETRARVIASIRALGYVHNSSASKLRTAGGDGLIIGLILRDVGNPFSAALHRSIEDALRASNSLVLAASNDDELGRAEYLVRKMLEHRAHGLIIAPPPGDQSYLADYVERGYPIVLVDRPAASLEIPYVISDNFSGVKSAVAHLAAIGHTRIAFFGDEDSVPMTERRDGFFAGVSECGISPSDATAILRRMDSGEAEREALRLLGRDVAPTAFVTGRNELTVGLIKALRRRGLQHEIALVSFDDLELGSELDPPLTAIAQDASEIGRTAAELLVRWITTGVAESGSVVVPTELTPRGSGEIPPRD